MASNFSAAPELALYVQSCCTQSADSGTVCVLTPVFQVLPGNFTVGSTRRLGATSSFWPYY